MKNHRRSSTYDDGKANHYGMQSARQNMQLLCHVMSFLWVCPYVLHAIASTHKDLEQPPKSMNTLATRLGQASPSQILTYLSLCLYYVL